MGNISVIIPVYNTGDYLGKCVDSVLRQGSLLREIILVDDGSTDDSPAICDRIAEAHPHLVRVFHRENGGAAAARNTGIDAARGEYLSFIDSDDYIETDAFEHLLNEMARYDADMSIGEMLVEKLDGSNYCHVSEGLSFCWTTEEALIELCSYRYLYVSAATALYKRSLFEGLRFPAGKICEEYYLQHQVFARCRRIAYSSKPFYHYVQRPQSVSRTTDISLAPIDASNQRVAFYREHFPRIAWAAETDSAIANMSVYTNYVRNGVSCAPDLLRTLQGNCRKYLRKVLKNNRIPPIKKLQTLTFCFCPWAYRLVVARTEHR